MEDDLIELKEDDQNTGKEDDKSEEAVIMKQKMMEEDPIEGTEILPDREVPDRDEQSPISEECAAPGHPVGRDTTVSPPLGDKDTKDKLVSAEASTRADSMAPPTEPKENEETVPLEENKKKKKNNITVNGVSLMDIMKMKSKSTGKKTPGKKTEKKKDVKKTDSPSPSMGDIRKFMQENTTKMTFRNTQYPQTSVRDRVQQYQKNTDSLRVNCVKSSGRCSTHNCVLSREIVRKKMSSLDKCGKIVWTMGEVTVLKCPLAPILPVSVDGQTSAIQQGLASSANKRRKKNFDNKTDKSDAQTQMGGCKED